MIIDMENHLFVKEGTAKGRSESGKICERYWDAEGKLGFRFYEDAANPEKFIQFMDDAGIDMAVLTNNGNRSLQDCKKWHDFCSEVVNKYPKRFAALATVPALGGRPAFDELERAVKGLGMKGVHFWTRADGHTLDSQKLWPFYEKVSELGIPIDVHITAGPTGFDALHAPWALYYIAAREFDMAMTVLRVCFGGVLEEFPDLVFIMNHFGGGVATVLERFDAYTSYADHPGWPDLYYGKRLISKPWREYFDRLYFSMAGREIGMATLKASLTCISPKRLLFATDWPFNYDYQPEGVRQYVAEIRNLLLPKEDIEGMLGGNAAKLLKL